MAYVEFLKYLSYDIDDLLNDSNTSPTREIIEFAQHEMKYVGGIVARMSWMGLLDLQIKIASEASDLVRKLVEKSNLSKLKTESSAMEVEDLKKEIQHFVAQMKKTEEEYGDALYNPLPPRDEDGIDVSESIGLEAKMVGLSDKYGELKEMLLKATYHEVIPIVGMPGIGKTTLAMKVFVDPDIVEHFEVRVWVTIGGKCSCEQIQQRILARLDPDCLNHMVAERYIARHLSESLKGKRYLIVVDDVWEKDIAHKLQLSSYIYPLSHLQNGSHLVVTTRLQQGGQITMRLLNKEESWDLLREKVFGEESCPTQLEKAGKKIAENCEGLPLTIITLADHLSKVEEVEYWDEVATKKNHKLFKEVYSEISKVLLPSYTFLPRLLQVCFLYMGVFPQNYEIPGAKLANMWNVDGFLVRNGNFDALHCLDELVSNSLVVIYKNTTGNVGENNIKTCGLHSSLWHLSTTEARKTKFCHVLISLDDGLSEDIIGQHRLSFHNNILCSIKDVYEFVEDNCASTIRCLLYYGPYHPYQVPICFGLSLLRKLDILTIRFYEFPMEILKLVELRYLTITLDGKIPISISQLSNLRFLIVGRHFVIIKPGRDRYLPVAIWNMQELQHLQAMGSDLPYPPLGASLENLSTLSNVSASTCAEDIFKATPNLDKLGFRIELTPNDDGIPLRCFDDISHLKKLRSLKCVVVNPNMIIPSNVYHHETPSPKIVTPLASITVLSSSLKKLSLSGLGFSWEEMRKISALPNLEVLKLQNYAFTGPYWRVKESEFPSLQFLVIEDSDIVEWSLESGCIQRLKCLTLKHCYKYERIVGHLVGGIRKIEFFACNPLGILQMQQTMSSPYIEWLIHSSLADGENGTQRIIGVRDYMYQK